MWRRFTRCYCVASNFTRGYVCRVTRQWQICNWLVTTSVLSGQSISRLSLFSTGILLSWYLTTLTQYNITFSQIRTPIDIGLYSFGNQKYALACNIANNTVNRLSKFFHSQTQSTPTKSYLNIPPRHKRVATLPCEICNVDYVCEWLFTTLQC